MFSSICIDIDELSLGKGFVRPKDCNDKFETKNLNIYASNYDSFSLITNTDFAEVALKILEPIYEEGEKIFRQISDGLETNKIVTEIVLGKNDKRIVDICSGGIGKCESLFEIPIVESEELNKIELIYKED